MVAAWGHPAGDQVLIFELLHSLMVEPLIFIIP